MSLVQKRRMAMPGGDNHAACTGVPIQVSLARCPLWHPRGRNKATPKMSHLLSVWGIEGSKQDINRLLKS